MRKIKFRAFLKREKVMVKVAEINTTDKFIRYYDTSHCKNDAEAFEFLRNEDPNAEDLFECIELMQFTGLYDKNGKEIYEGDIVQIKGHAFQRDERGIGIDIDGNYVVKWSKKMELILSVSLEDDDGWLLNRNVHYAEVIGNIYENPELLEGSEKNDSSENIR